MEDQIQTLSDGDGDLLADIDAGTGIEVVRLPEQPAEVEAEAARAERRLIRPPTIVPGRAEGADPPCLHLVDRLGDDAVLEHRLGEVDDIVGNHLRPGVGEIDDALGKIGLPAVRGVEGDRGPRGDVMDDLGERPAFIGHSLAPARAFFEHLDRGRQVATRNPGRRTPEAIEVEGKDAHFDPRAVHAEGIARDVRAYRGISLARDGADPGHGMRPGAANSRESSVSRAGTAEIGGGPIPCVRTPPAL